jgi:predicted RecA/RadA family phage recombinase
MQNYLGDGDVLTIIAPVPVVSGQPLLIGSMFGICLASAAEGQPVEFWLKGVYQLAKNAAEVWAQGVALFWDNTNAVVTLTSGGNTRIGVAAAAAANPSNLGNVRLNGSF